MTEETLQDLRYNVWEDARMHRNLFWFNVWDILINEAHTNDYRRYYDQKAGDYWEALEVQKERWAKIFGVEWSPRLPLELPRYAELNNLAEDLQALNEEIFPDLREMSGVQ